MTELAAIRVPDMPNVGESLARVQRSVLHPEITFPLWPPLLRGDPASSTGDICFPVEVGYDLGALSDGFFGQEPRPGLGRWQPLLPPLANDLGVDVGGTPLVAAPEIARFAGADAEVFVKDESRNPTWSHKDRLNAVAVSTAVHVGAPGVAVASSGNHGASAAAHAARAGLSCIVFASSGTPPAVQSLLAAYDATVILVPREKRWELLNAAVERLGVHPVSNLTPTHTGHPYGPEGYKTISYELYRQLGNRAPAAIFVPTGYAELLYGTWRGFDELWQLGLIEAVPRMMACEPAACGVLGMALRRGLSAETLPSVPTKAYSIATTVGGYRGIAAIRRSNGQALAVADEEMVEASNALRRIGLWQELSGCAGVAGLRSYVRGGGAVEGPVVCIATSSGFKDHGVGEFRIRATASTWEDVEAAVAPTSMH